jgi:high-affinity K+ transport system ATPase subunit B
MATQRDEEAPGRRPNPEGLRRTLRHTLRHTLVRLLGDEPPSIHVVVYAHTLRRGDVILVTGRGMIPCDGEVIAGSGMVDESPATGSRTPVARSAGGPQAAVIAGTRLLSGELTVRITSEPAEDALGADTGDSTGRRLWREWVGRWGIMRRP